MYDFGGFIIQSRSIDVLNIEFRKGKRYNDLIT